MKYASTSFVPETSRYKLEEVDKVFRCKTGQIMRNGWEQMKWLAGKKGRDCRRWVLKDYPVLVPRSNDRKFDEMEREMNAINEDSEAANGHIASPAEGSDHTANQQDS